MEKIVIKVKDSDTDLIEILRTKGYQGIPTNVILNKRRPGIGATKGEIKSPRHSIIIEPFVAVMEVKKTLYKRNLCIVKSGVKDNAIVAHLKDDTIPFKKIMTTPESFDRVIKILKAEWPNYRKEFFLLFDECEKVIKQAIFRKKMADPLPEFFEFDNKAFVSATPLIPNHPKFQEAGFIELDIVPEFEYRKNINIIVTNNIRTSLRNFLRIHDDGHPIFIFTNCSATILYATTLELVKDNFKVFCASTLDKKFFKKQGLQNVKYSVAQQSYAKNNVFTSRFFSGVDMFVDGKAPHVLMITNLPDVDYSIIDPGTEAIQIYGRCRRGVQSITHITNLYSERMTLEKDDIKLEVEEEINFIQKLRNLKKKSHKAISKDIADAFIDKQFASTLFNKDESVNDYWKDNFIDERIVQNYYTSSRNLKSAYIESKFFIPKIREIEHPVSSEDSLKLIKAKGKDIRREVAQQLKNLIDKFGLYHIRNDSNEFFERLTELRNKDQLTYEVFFEKGYDYLAQIDFSIPVMRDELFKLKQRSNDNYMLMVDKILLSFPLNKALFSNKVKVDLQNIYNEFKFEKSFNKIHTAKASDILDYFDGKYIEPKKANQDGSFKTYYMLTGPKNKVSKDLQYLKKYSGY
jgi:hypothetical protein